MRRCSGRSTSDSCATRSRPSRSSRSSRRQVGAGSGTPPRRARRGRGVHHTSSRLAARRTRERAYPAAAPSTTRFPTASPTSSRCSAPPASANRVWSESCTTVSMRRRFRLRLPYGDGITYWPVRRDRAAGVGDRLRHQPRRDRAADKTDPERLAHEAARRRLRRLQWGEPTFLDLVDHVTDLARDAPILLGVCRPTDLLDGRPGWGGAQRNDDAARRTDGGRIRAVSRQRPSARAWTST